KELYKIGEEFQRNYNMPIESIADPCRIECQVCEYCARQKKMEENIRLKLFNKQSMELIDILLSTDEILQEKELDEKEGSVALTAQQVVNITLFRLIQSDGSILFYHYYSKNNQCGILGSATQNIHLPSDLPRITGLVSDIVKYISKHPSDTSIQNFIKDIGNKVKVQLPDGILTNHSGRKTAAQILQDADIPENAIMNITRHKSAQDDSTNITAQNPFIVLTESTKSYMNVNSFLHK
ncbi:32579_t:CDS:2, partial [Gigaspora margarita]